MEVHGALPVSLAIEKMMEMGLVVPPRIRRMPMITSRSQIHVTTR